MLALLTVSSSIPLDSGSRGSSSASAQTAEWTDRLPIVINGDTKFTYENGVTGGNGTKADPYIIEGWRIGPSPNGSAIDIRFTTAHFRIRDVYAFSCSFGVSMNTVDNGWIEDSQFVGNTVGASFYECDNCKVLRSTFEGSDIAISISFSDVSQSDNTFINNDVNVVRNKQEMLWELTWVGAAVCSVILIPLVAIISILVYYRIRRHAPPRP